MFNDAYIDSLHQGRRGARDQRLESKLKASPDQDFLSFVYGLAKDAPSFQLSWDQALTRPRPTRC